MWLAVMDLGEGPRATVIYIFSNNIQTCVNVNTWIQIIKNLCVWNKNLK
jgi:hypothetical protein